MAQSHNKSHNNEGGATIPGLNLFTSNFKCTHECFRYAYPDSLHRQSSTFPTRRTRPNKARNESLLIESTRRELLAVVVFTRCFLLGSPFIVRTDHGSQRKVVGTLARIRFCYSPPTRKEATHCQCGRESHEESTTTSLATPVDMSQEHPIIGPVLQAKLQDEKPPESRPTSFCNSAFSIHNGQLYRQYQKDTASKREEIRTRSLLLAWLYSGARHVRTVQPQKLVHTLLSRVSRSYVNGSGGGLFQSQIVVGDYFTRWMEAFAIPNQEATVDFPQQRYGPRLVERFNRTVGRTSLLKDAVPHRITTPQN